MLHIEENVAIVVLNYNGLSLLKQYLEPLVNFSKGYKVVLVDNASKDGSVAYVKQHFPQVLCILHDQNYGVTKGYNRTLAQMDVPYYVLINNDVLVTPGWLEPMVNLLNNNPKIAFCQPKILSYRHPTYFDYAGAAGGFLDGYGVPFCRGRILNHIEKDQGQYDDTCPIFWSSGACCLVRSAVFHAIGRFDERFFAHFDEIDLCLRAQLAGWQVYYCGQSTVYHLGGGTLSYKDPKKTYLNCRNRALMLYKIRTPLFPKPIVRCLGDILVALYRFFQGKFTHGWAILRAQIAFLKLKNYLEPYEVKTMLPNVYRRSIVVDSMFKNKTMFSKLDKKAFTKWVGLHVKP